MNIVRIFLLSAFLPALVNAGPVLWTLSNVNFNYGAVAAGSFIYDADFDQYSAVNIVTTNDSIRNGATFTREYVSYFFNVGRPVQEAAFLTNATGNLTNTPQLVLEFYSPLTDGGGTTTLLGSSERSCYDASCSVGTGPLRSLNGTIVGVPVTTPEPSSALLAALGVAGVMLAHRKLTAAARSSR